MTTAQPKAEFSVSHLKDARYESEGLRSFFARLPAFAMSQADPSNRRCRGMRP